MEKSKILSYMTKPYESYVDTNSINLRNVFKKIKRENHIGNREFKESIQPVITAEIERYYKKEYGDEAVFWGAWFKEPELEDMQVYKLLSTLTEVQKETLAKMLKLEDISGELLGYGLCVFAGLSVTEVMSARYRDIEWAGDDRIISTIYTRGAFPKKGKASEYDALPRRIPLIAPLENILKKRLSKIEESLVFPLETEQGVFSCAGDLPIACRGQDPTLFCHISELSSYARDILRCALDFDEMSMTHMSSSLLEIPGRFAFERSASYWLGRKTFGRILYDAASTDEARRYIIGYKADDEEGPGRIVDVSEEELEETKKELDRLTAWYFA